MSQFKVSIEFVARIDSGNFVCPLLFLVDDSDVSLEQWGRNFRQDSPEKGPTEDEARQLKPILEDSLPQLAESILDRVSGLDVNAKRIAIKKLNRVLNIGY